MCGVCGMVTRSEPDPEGMVARMLGHLRMRGPDADGLVRVGEAVLGHTRLKVIDLSADNAQPMRDPGGRYTLTYNGEIYNFEELRAELSALGHRFRTRGDTEVVLAAFLAWGEDCLRRFNGMFAFALWDSKEHRLFLARDRMGEKPLHYALSPAGDIAFASEPLALNDFARGGGADATAIFRYLAFNYIPGDATPWRRIRQLEPGCFAWFERGRGVAIRRYWDPATAYHDKRPGGFDEAARELAELVEDAVRIRRRSDRPVGCLLSGGLDSTIVLSCLDRGDSPVPCFTAAFDEAGFDETMHARRVADAFGHPLHTCRIEPTPGRLSDSLAAMARAPLGDSSFFALHALCGSAASRATVALTGDGADELFLGYPTTAADQLAHRIRSLPRFARRGLASAADWLPARFGKVSLDYKLRKFLRHMHLEPNLAHLAWRSIFDLAELEGIFTEEFLRTVDPVAAFEGLGLEPEHREALDLRDQSALLDLRTWLPNGILVKSDRASMAHGMELRAPFLDPRVVDMAARLPPSAKRARGQGKRILRAAFAQRIPAATLRRRKAGFNAPVSEWFAGAFGHALEAQILDSALVDVVRRDRIVALFDAHRARRADNSLRILGLASLAPILGTM